MPFTIVNAHKMDPSLSQASSTCVTFNMRGFSFQLDTKYLIGKPQTRLCMMYNEQGERTGKIRWTFNRDPFIFSTILDYYVTDTLHLTSGACAEKFRDELEYWGVGTEALCVGCRIQYEQQLSAAQELRGLVKIWRADKDHPDADCPLGDGKSFRQRLWYFLEGEQPCKAAKVYAGFLTVVSLLSVTVVGIATLPTLRVLDPGENKTDPRQYDSVLELITRSFMAKSLYFTDLVLIAILTVDLALRFAAARTSKEYFKSYINLIGILSVVPAIFIYVLLGLDKYGNLSVHAVFGQNFDYVVYVLFVFEGCRVLYILRIAKYYQPLKIILLTLQESRTELLLLSGGMIIGASLFGHAAYALELHRTSFWSIPEATWWAIITMTTIGYGDELPQTPLGMILGSFCALFGIIFIALPIPIVSSNFLKMYNVSKLRDRKDDD